MTLSASSLRTSVAVVCVICALTIMTSRESFAFSAEAQQMCSGDAFRLCSSEIPNIPAITACMVKHRSDLTAGCRADREEGRQGRRCRSSDVESGIGVHGMPADSIGLRPAMVRFRTPPTHEGPGARRQP